ncbi:hypothetical protein K523DRAFT_319414 [Schizophyllum commune Tattone D]|nr:hypothetical protein K523DRAFT_319414 [Schizophyllum commune Tattone D]
MLRERMPCESGDLHGLSNLLIPWRPPAPHHPACDFFEEDNRLCFRLRYATCALYRTRFLLGGYAGVAPATAIARL